MVSHAGAALMPAIADRVMMHRTVRTRSGDRLRHGGGLG
jgi:hypothetical protein